MIAELEADFDAGVVERMTRFELDSTELVEVQEVHLQTKVQVDLESTEAELECSCKFAQEETLEGVVTT